MADWRWEYPFSSRRMTIDRFAYHYIDEGQGDSPIVCVHGNPTWSFYYRRIISAFRNTNRVLAVDHIGCGMSDKPTNYNYTLAQHTQNLVAWMDQLDLSNATLVVHDWGGAIGLGAAVARPQRIAKLVILNTGAFPPTYIPLRIAACRIPLLGSWAIRYLNAFAVAATWMAIDRLPKLSEEARNGLLFPYNSPKNRIGIDGFVRDIPTSKRHPTYRVLEELEAALPSLADKPTQFIWGMRDWCFRPDCLTRLQQSLPIGKSRLLQDVGHYVMEEAADEVIAEIHGLVGPKP